VVDALLPAQEEEASFREELQALLAGWQSRIATLQQRQIISRRCQAAAAVRQIVWQPAL
jgi:hypothetical protein